MPKRSIHLRITKHYLGHIERDVDRYCPIELALRRRYGSDTEPVVSTFGWAVRYKHHTVIARGTFPDRTATFIRHWDAGKRVRPTKLELYVD